MTKSTDPKGLFPFGSLTAQFSICYQSFITYLPMHNWFCESAKKTEIMYNSHFQTESFALSQEYIFAIYNLVLV